MSCSSMLFVAVAFCILFCTSAMSVAMDNSLASKLETREYSNNCVLQWLLALGISEPEATSYALLFVRESVDEQSLKHMSMEQLESLGISKFGHRVLIHSSLNGVSDVPTPCQNGGQCIYSTANDSFLCSCRNGFSGNLCETVTDECVAAPCLNGGICLREGSQTRCNCQPGFRGEKCEHDHCSNQPCQHGGVCTATYSGYNCSCLFGFDGRDCERAWLTPTDYMSLTDRLSQLSMVTDSLNEAAVEERKKVEVSLISLLDQVVSTQGPRYFKPWHSLPYLGISQVKHFKRGDRNFIGAINTNSRHAHYGLNIFELSTTSISHIQTIRSLSLSSFKSFSVGGVDYIATANSLDRYGRSIERSKLYRWNGTLYTLEQEFATRGAMDVDFVTAERVGSFLAFSCHHNGSSYNTPSLVYVWDTVSRVFIQFQSLPTTGAQRLHFFTWQGSIFLTVACERNALGSGQTDSILFRWSGTHFDVGSLIPTSRAHELYPFTVGCEAYLGVSNFYNGLTHNIDSKIYRLDGNTLIEHASLATRGAVAMEAFTVKSEHFLAVANSHDEESGSSRTSSVIYKMDGPNFVQFQEIQTAKAAHVHFFSTADGCSALAVANWAGMAELYKWTSVSLVKDSCCV